LSLVVSAFIFVAYRSKWFFCVTSLEEIFVKCGSCFFNLAEIGVHAPYSVYVLDLLLCRIWHLYIQIQD